MSRSAPADTTAARDASNAPVLDFPVFDDMALLGKRHDMVQGVWEHMTTVAWPQMFGDEITESKVHGIRPMMTSEMLDTTDPSFLEHASMTEEMVDTTVVGGAERSLKIFIYTPKTATATEAPPLARKCVLWFHGGGFILSEASYYHRRCSKMCAEWDAVIVNVDIGVAPETKAPNWALHGYAALKHIIANSSRLGVDASRLALHGVSSGGYTSMVVAMELAKRGEAHLVSLAASHIGAFNNDFLTEPDEDPGGDPLKSDLHASVHTLHMDTMKMVCTDWASQFESADPDVFPAQASDAVLAKLPPIFLSTAEFDQFRRGNEMFATRLSEHGKLVCPLYILPGCGHGLETPEAAAKLAADEAKIFGKWL